MINLIMTSMILNTICALILYIEITTEQTLPKPLPFKYKIQFFFAPLAVTMKIIISILYFITAITVGLSIQPYEILQYKCNVKWKWAEHYKETIGNAHEKSMKLLNIIF